MKKKINKLYEIVNTNKSNFTTACLNIDSPDFFSAADDAKNINIYKTGRDNPLINLSNASSSITSLLLNINQAELYSGLKGGMIILWDLESGKVKSNLSSHSTMITSLYLSKLNSNPYILASGSLDGKVKLWDMRNYKNGSVNLKGHFESIKSLSISPDCNYIASGSEDKLVRLWDIRQNKLLKEFSILDQGVVNCVEFNPHSITLAYGCNDRTVKHWDLERYDLISITPLDKLPIVKIKFDFSGKNAYVATNETLKYWMIDDSQPYLIDLMEPGWKILQDMQYFACDGLYGLSTYGAKITLWNLPEKNNLKKNSKELISNNLNPSEFVNLNISNGDNGEGEKIIVQKNFVINNISSNISINTNLDRVTNDILRELNNDQYVDESINLNNYINVTTTSFVNYNSNEPMNIDLNKFMKLNNPDETVHDISSSNDLPMIQEINEFHSTFESAILKRYKSLKMVSKWWLESDISSTLNALKLMKDLSVINDFFSSAFLRDDINKLPFNLEHSMCIIPHIKDLIESKYEIYRLTGCKSGIVMLRNVSEKIFTIKNSITEDKEDKLKRCEQIVDMLKVLFKSQKFIKICQRNDSPELKKIANSLYTDLEFFLKPLKKNSL